MLYIFTASLVVISLMILLKVMENKIGRKTFISKNLSKLDIVFVGIFKNIKEAVLRIFIDVKSFILKQIFSYLRSFFGSVKNHVDEKYTEINSSLRGRRVIKSNGLASFYLRDISEFKSNNFRNLK